MQSSKEENGAPAIPHNNIGKRCDRYYTIGNCVYVSSMNAIVEIGVVYVFKIGTTFIFLMITLTFHTFLDKLHRNSLEKGVVSYFPFNFLTVKKNNVYSLSMYFGN